MSIKKRLFLLGALITAISAFSFPEAAIKKPRKCRTTLNASGRCVDVHECPKVLRQIALEHLYPKICDFDSKGETLSVCCDDDDENDVCGFAFAEESGFESALDDENKRGSSSMSVFRRPPEQEALFTLANRVFGSNEDEYKVSTLFIGSICADIK